MWKKLPYSAPFYILFTQENGFFIYISDYISIWWVSYSEKDFLKRLQQSNEDLEIEDVNHFIQIGVQMLMHPEKLKRIRISKEEKWLNITMTSSAKFPVCLDIKLAEGSKEMFYQKITYQLLKIVQDLKASEHELRTSLIKKDKEIEEYKSETDVRLARYLKTAVYNDEQHMTKHAAYQKNFGLSDVPECLLERVPDKQKDEVVEKIKQEIKSEPKSQPTVQNEPVCPIIKSEAVTQATDTPSISSLTNGAIKREVKCDPQVVNPKKKLRLKLKL